MKNVFDVQTASELIERINKLSPDTKPLWGTMAVGQMLAHCNITYETVYEDKHPKPNFVMGFFLKAFVKNSVVGEKPYSRNGQTAPHFVVKDDKDFDAEKQRLIAHITKTQELGTSYFDNRESHSFGKLTQKEWSNLFYKHLDHHLSQFGV